MFPTCMRYPPVKITEETIDWFPVKTKSCIIVAIKIFDVLYKLDMDMISMTVTVSNVHHPSLKNTYRI